MVTVAGAGWSGKKNGELLKLAETKFDVFITIDQNLQYQVNLLRARIPIIVLSAKTSCLDDLTPLIPKILTAMNDLSKGITRIKL